MESQTTRYAVLRDGQTWEGATLLGLQPEAEGGLTLARIPGSADGTPIMPLGLFAVALSGIAVGGCNDVYLADTANHNVVWLDGVSNTRMVLPGSGGMGNAPGQFNQPRGLLVANDSLYVADSGNGRVQVFHLPALELHAIWEGVLQTPVGLAADRASRIYVLDRGLKRVLRYSAQGVPDQAYNAAMAQQPGLASPVALAMDGTDVLYVADEVSNQVLSFDARGVALRPLPSAGAGPTKPCAMAARGDRLYVADAKDGRVWAFDCLNGSYLGTLSDYRGPVSALAVGEIGALFIKPGLGEAIHVLQADAACVSTGVLLAGPLDAGEGEAWQRVHTQIDLPTGTSAQMRLFTGADRNHAPVESDWASDKTLAGALDTLVSMVQAISGAPQAPRYLWLRIELDSDDARRVSPRVIQVQAETAGEDYLDYLPAVYRREDAPGEFLKRWLALHRAELGDWEMALGDMSRRFDPATALENQLPWLASWLAFELPWGQDAEKWRRLLLDAHALYQRRGTPGGLREFIRIYTGVQPVIFEAFQERRIWQLGHTSALGFDTALASASPDGVIVPGLTPADPSYMGLRGDYYSGLDFATFILTRTDPTVDFQDAGDWPSSLGRDENFSVRWSGQVQPRYSENYAFQIQAGSAVRLWVDGLPIEDNWSANSPKYNAPQIALSAGTWYTIRLEYNHVKGEGLKANLSWSSRTQSQETIPHNRLYSVRDEGANLASPSEAETMLVGQTVVGESSPLATSEYGIPLFSETAHLFTVVVPAGNVPEQAQRAELQRVIEAEKPAHTDYDLCFVEARMRVGYQARLGVDSIIAAGPDPMDLDHTTLGLDTVLLAQGQDQAGRVGTLARLGRDTVIG